MKTNKKLNTYNNTAIVLPIKTQDYQKAKKIERKLGDTLIENGISILNLTNNLINL